MIHSKVNVLWVFLPVIMDQRMWMYRFIALFYIYYFDHCYFPFNMDVEFSCVTDFGCNLFLVRLGLAFRVVWLTGWLSFSKWSQPLIVCCWYTYIGIWVIVGCFFVITIRLSSQTNILWLYVLCHENSLNSTLSTTNPAFLCPLLDMTHRTTLSHLHPTTSSNFYEVVRPSIGWSSYTLHSDLIHTQQTSYPNGFQYTEGRDLLIATSTC